MLKNIIPVFAISALISGCADQGVFAPSGLDLPAAALMKKAKPLPPVAKVGDDVGVNNLKVRNVCSVEISKLTRLQRYVRKITAK